MRTNERKLYKYNLYKLLEKLQDEMIIDSTESIEESINTVSNDLEAMYEDKARSSAFRARVRFTEGGIRTVNIS